MPNLTKTEHRIPYDVWINSHMSIAQHYGGIIINGDEYKLDFKNAREENGKSFPDLVCKKRGKNAKTK